MKRISIALAALMIAAPARAEMVELRDYWTMTCFPRDTAPYQVEIAVEAGPIDPQQQLNVACSHLANVLGVHGRQRAEFRDSCKEQPE